jgi:hypothetical protein
MIAGACACVVLVAWLVRGAKETDLKRMDHSDLARLRLLSEQAQRREIYPFE